MSIADWLGISKTIPKTVEAVSQLYTTDKARLEAEKEIAQVIQKSDNLAGATNIVDAKSLAMFQSSWRPLLGWTAGACLALYYIPQILLTEYFWALQCIAKNAVVPFPMKADDILNLVYILLGFGAYRMIEKKF